jgi:hypothetical protein
MADDPLIIDGADGDDGKGAGSGTADDGAGKGADGADAGAGKDGGADAVDWRARMAGEDPDLSKFLGRYTSEAAALRDFKKLHGDMRSGKFIKPLDENATDEEKAAYRKQLGVPDEPKGYLDKLPDGLVVGEDDRPFVDVFLGKMHEAGAPPGLTGAALEAYYQIVEEQAAAESDQLATAKVAGEEALRAEWGKDYRRNLNALHGHLDTLPPEVKEAFTNGRGADGVPLGYNPEVMKWLSGLALEANPLATVVPGAGANQASAIADEIAKIEKMMREDRSAYNKDEKIQARYRELVSAREKLPK